MIINDTNLDLVFKGFQTVYDDAYSYGWSYEHQNDKAAQNGPVPAAGWITEIASSATGIWGRVKWTERAARMIEAREYRYLSPVLMRLKDGRVTRITGAGSVHSPALELTALAEQETDMRDTETMLQRIAEMLGLEGTPALEDFVAALAELKGASGDVDPTKFAPVEAMRELMGDRNAAVNQLRESAALAKVDQAQQAGFISPGMRRWALALCSRDEASFDAFIGGAPPAFAHLMTSKLDTVHPDTFKAQPALSGEAASICAPLGLKADRLSS